MIPMPKYGKIIIGGDKMLQRKLMELTIEYNIINKMLRKLRDRKEKVWNEIKQVEEEANGLR